MHAAFLRGDGFSFLLRQAGGGAPELLLAAAGAAAGACQGALQ